MPFKSPISFKVNYYRCPYPKCTKLTTHILYFLVGPNLDIKSQYGALCEAHANQLKEEYSKFRECQIIAIGELNDKLDKKD